MEGVPEEGLIWRAQVVELLPRSLEVAPPAPGRISCLPLFEYPHWGSLDADLKGLNKQSS